MLTSEPVRYLSEFWAAVPASEFEQAVDAFINLVLGRLNEKETELAALWREVLRERADAEQMKARKIEARLGFDPDEAPASLVRDFLELAGHAGQDAADEIAPICTGDSPAQSLQQIITLASAPGIPGRIELPLRSESSDQSLPPWLRAKSLARSARKALGLNGMPLSDESLCQLLQISTEDLRSQPTNRANLGLAVRTDDEMGFKFNFHRKHLFSRRFEAARFIGDCVSASDKWLPLTDARTARQKMQRAFAAEFLCPIDALRKFLNDEFTPEAFEDASDYFRISEMAITSHLANNHLIPRTLTDEPQYP
jgi:hypothetical protein